MKKHLAALLVLLFLVSAALAQPQEKLPRTLLSLRLLQDIINEANGELALQNEIYLTAVNRNRKAEEYATGYFETGFILEKLKEYGYDEAQVLELPSRDQTVWDAEEAELWMVEPVKKKIADLKEIPAVLCSGSASTDVTAELVEVGPGFSEDHYKNKDVKGKIVLVYGSPEAARRLAVEKFGAVGLIGCSSSHPEFDRDQIGWSSIRVGPKDKPTFAFMVSERTYFDLKMALERKTRIVLRALVKTQRVPAREEMAVGLIKGAEKPEEELVLTAHLFEGYAKQGANDDASGCVAILEAGRVLKKMMADGTIPPLKRSVRFLFVPEISGTRAYIQKYPEVARRFFANINEDMVGEALVKNLSAFRLEVTPYSLPTYLNDVVASFVEWMGASQRISQDGGWKELAVLSPAGSRDPFYYSIDPYSGGSDHIVFIDGAVKVPAVMFICWPDMWYHTSGDLPDKSDSTQLKRVVTLTVASAIFLANAGPEEARAILNEVSARSLGRLGREKGRAIEMIMKAESKGLAAARKEAVNILRQAVAREKEALESARFFAGNDRQFTSLLAAKLNTLDQFQVAGLNELEELYRQGCQRHGLKPEKLTLTPDEVRLSRVVPVRKPAAGEGDPWMVLMRLREMNLQLSPLIYRAEFELRNFIDGKKSILDIRNAASAEYDPLPLLDVEKYFQALEKAGMVELKKK
ncbi:MAG: Aminopeptidase, family M28, containing PA domain [Candidatus Saccharicenans subterraneus]|uniref:Carboxypeptidase Q n=1 Tax=Candidatus Saccharicenans subterraneus TaxID=2508984 RepID=A0A3E2BP00_9BACT|nr:MAG: Aminopeptidase, family M28, containing PA domain [Candidatus Saccharicenans subterraneum]